MLTVHLRVNDAATGKPTPARVRVSADGAQFAPLGRFVEFPTGRNEVVGGQLAVCRERWFYTDGSCEIPLPAGVPLRVQATKGPEYTPLDQTATLGAGQMTLRFAIERWADTRADGWVSVDTRCHFLTPHDALLEAAAEGIAVANVLAAVQPFPSLDGTAYTTVPNLTAVSGRVPALERDGTSVVVSTLNTHPVLGKVALLHSHRPVFPLTFGGDEETDDWGVCDWCDQCHRKGGLTVWVDAFEPNGGLIGGEALVAAILGKIDAIEVSTAPRKVPLLPWVYRLWDAGFLVPLVGASGKDSNKVALGGVRAYVLANPDREGGANPVAWVEAIRAGQTFATAGPLLHLAHDKERFRASARALVPFGKLEHVANGRVVASAECVADGPRFRAEADSPVPADGWFAARCSGTTAFAHTSPVSGPSRTPNPAAVAALVKLIDQTREWAETRGRYANPKRKEQLLARCAGAAAKLVTP